MYAFIYVFTHTHTHTHTQRYARARIQDSNSYTCKTPTCTYWNHQSLRRLLHDPACAQGDKHNVGQAPPAEWKHHEPCICKCVCIWVYIYLSTYGVQLFMCTWRTTPCKSTALVAKSKSCLVYVSVCVYVFMCMSVSLHTCTFLYMHTHCMSAKKRAHMRNQQIQSLKIFNVHTFYVIVRVCMYVLTHV